jgi:hypothetical protein
MNYRDKLIDEIVALRAYTWASLIPVGQVTFLITAGITCSEVN